MLKREAFEVVVHHLSAVGFKLLLDILASAPASVRVEEVAYASACARSGRASSTPWWRWTS